MRSCKDTSCEGFTLIELSIVLVIIGLIVGGVLAGQDLIRAAGERATISQIERYNSAVNTFRGKYGALPGDLNAQIATTFGFWVTGGNGSNTRGAYSGEGDGNGIIEGTQASSSNLGVCGACPGAGEPVLFWDDLTYANGQNVNLIDGSFPPPSGFPIGNLASVPTSLVSSFFPAAKLGNSNFIYVYSVNATTYYGLSVVSSLSYYQLFGGPGLTVKQAYDIDKKVDDGLPLSGAVQAQYVNYNITALAAIGASGGGVAGAASGTAVTGSSTTCYDNSGSAANAMQYSLEISGGSIVNCALSFQFQ